MFQSGDALFSFLLTRCSCHLRYLFASEAYPRMVGLRPKDFGGKPIVDIMGKEGFRTILPHVDEVLRRERLPVSPWRRPLARQNKPA